MFIVLVAIIPSSVHLTNKSSSSFETPWIVCPATNVPTILSSPNIISVTVSPPIENLKTFSTIAVASFILALPGTFSCVIVWSCLFYTS